MNDPNIFKGMAVPVVVTLAVSGLFAIITAFLYLVAGGFNEAADWGAVGDFFGGILNPVFAFANVIILVVISYQLALIDEQRARRDLKNQKKMALYSLKHESLQRMVGVFDKMHLLVFNSESSLSIQKIRMVKMDILAFLATHIYLFPVIRSEDITNLDKAMADIILAAKPWSEPHSTKPETVDTDSGTRLTDAMIHFASLRTGLILRVSDSLVEDLHVESDD